MSIDIDARNETVRERGRIARLISIAVASLLAFTGLVALPASAATGAQWKGTGYDVTKSVSLEPGIYKMNVDYTGHSGSSSVSATVQSDSFSVFHYLDAGVSTASGSMNLIFRLPQSEKVYAGVNSADNAQWNVSITKRTEPTKAKNEFALKGTGTSASSLLRLTQSTYAMNFEFSGNADGDWPGVASLEIFGPDDYWEPLYTDFTISGKITLQASLPEEGTYWLRITTNIDAEWSLEAANG